MTGNSENPFQVNRRGPVEKLKRSFWKTLGMFPIYIELHHGWTRGVLALAKSTWNTGKSGGLSAIFRRMKHYRTLAGCWLDAPSPWQYSRLSPPSIKTLSFSILVPIPEETPVEIIDRCLKSVLIQVGMESEITLIGDPQTVQRWRAFSELKECEQDRIFQLTSIDCSSSVQQACEQLDEKWVAIIEPHCVLLPNAMIHFNEAISDEIEVDWIYPDAVRLGKMSRFHKGLLRPDFSREFLLSQYFCEGLHLIRNKKLLEAARTHQFSFRTLVYDLLLRVSEASGVVKVQHLPIPMIEVNDSHSPKRLFTNEHRFAAQNSLKRQGVGAIVTNHPRNSHTHRINFQLRSAPTVNIFIATRNACELVKAAVDSIRSRTEYDNYKIIVIDNQSDEPELLDYLKEESSAGKLATFRYDLPFNHSEMHNLAVEEFPADYLVLVNNDIVITSNNWLEEMIASAEAFPEIAGVGALLNYPDQTIQHAGIALGVHYGAGHFFRGQRLDSTTYMERAISLQQLSACTAALLLLRHKAFVDVNGFDAQRYPASFNDVDLWLRLQRAGHRCLYNPEVQAIHYESKTRPLISKTEQNAVRQLQQDWGQELIRDPFHHPAISLDNEALFGFRKIVPSPTHTPITQTRRAA